MKQVKLIIAGAGNRGFTFANYAKEYPEQVKVVGVAEPRDFQRKLMAEQFSIPKENVFEDWKQLIEREKFADAVVISTPDSVHYEPAVEFCKKGYHILLEKPISPIEKECIEIAETAKNSGVIFAICHVLRYADYTQKLKQIINSGRIGQIISLQHLEPIGYWHFAHSYVRGNWRNEKESSFMLLAKSCHDLDWIEYIMDKKCSKIQSFGNLKYFNENNKPENAADRCLDCPLTKSCPYSAEKIYLDKVRQGHTQWPVDVITDDTTEQGVIKALKEGPYGRCVYSCDNDVVDHQTVNMLFEDEATATFTVTAFTEMTNRRTTIFGSEGEIYGDGEKIQVYDFRTDKKETIETGTPDGSILSGHGGGDHNLMQNFVKAVSENNPKSIISDPAENINSHLMAFAAEKSRKENKVIELEL